MYTIDSEPSEGTLVLEPGASLSVWITRADRPEYACITLEAMCGYVDLTNPEDWTCALVAFMGSGAVTLDPMPRAPSDAHPVTLKAGDPPANLLLKPGETIDLWCKPDGKVWHARRLLANINANGVRLTAGRGGRGKRGCIRLRAAGPNLHPPVDAWTLRDLTSAE